MTLRDRGTKKWTSLMLPEHVEALQELWREQDYKEMPVLDEQQIVENNLLLQEALDNNVEVSVKYFADNDYKTVTGDLLMIDPMSETIYFKDIQIEMRYIIEVSLL